MYFFRFVLNSDLKREGQKYIKSFINEKFMKQFYFFTCMWVIKAPDKNHFENMRADFYKVSKVTLSKVTSANYPWNDAFSGMKKFKKKSFNLYYVIAFDLIHFRDLITQIVSFVLWKNWGPKKNLLRFSNLYL